jgi:hypothetical protein
MYYRCTVENSDGVECEVSVHSIGDGVYLNVEDWSEEAEHIEEGSVRTGIRFLCSERGREANPAVAIM